MARYCAKLAGLYPTNDIEAVQADALADSFADALVPIGYAYREKDTTKASELKKAVVEGSLPDFLAYLEKVITDNGTG